MALPIEGEWSVPIRISEAIQLQWWTQVPENSKGVYRLMALSSNQFLLPAPINRVCGVDEKGTLYIGASMSLKNRISSLVQMHHPDYKSNPHIALSKVLMKLFPAEKLAMSWQLTNNPWEREAELLSAYEEVFGELPPRNSQTPKPATAIITMPIE